jgi:hypothetical protein
VVISERLWSRLFPGTNPVGRQIDLGGRAKTAALVVGVVKGPRHRPEEREPREAVYIPYTQADLDELGQMNILTRSNNPDTVIPELPSEVQRLNQNLPLQDIETGRGDR